MAAMNIQKRNNVSIYNLSSGPTLPEWLGDRAKRNLSKRDEAVRRRIELIQDFQMPSSSSKVVQSNDGRYIMVGGTYPPRVRCFDVHDLTMKFERYVNAEIVDLVMLGEDYGKMGILMDDRTIAFHAHYGAHETVRIPKFGRAMAYEPTTCELLVAASGTDVYRLNLEEGRFSQPWTTETADVSASCIAVAQSQPLTAIGFVDGIVRFWDNRSPDSLLKPFLKLDVQSATAGYGYADDDHPMAGTYQKNRHEITSLAYDTSGLYMAAGTAGGLVALYDVRSSKPLHIKEHKHGMPIHTLKFHPGSGCILSSDEKLVKIWKYKSTGDLVNNTGAGVSADRFGALSALSDETNQQGMGAVVANVEGSGKFHNFIMAGDERDPLGNSSGILMCATDQPKLECYYIPKVGLAPKWCSFLENITEELEERDLQRDGGISNSNDPLQNGQETIFENYKFVSHDDLEQLGVSDLIGTPMLRAYMHGFFMDIHLYNRIRAVANPFEYEEYRKKKLKERLDAKRASRIAPKASSQTKVSSVNPDLAERLQDRVDKSATTKAGKVANQLLKDDRFGRLFSNPDFEIDQEDEYFRLRNPSGVADANSKRKSGKRNDMDSDEDDDDDDDNLSAGAENGQDNPVDDEVIGFKRVGQDDGDSADDAQSSDDSDSSDDDDDGIRGGKVRGEAYDELRTLAKKKKNTDSKPNESKKKSKKQERKTPANKKTILYEAHDIGDVNPVALGTSSSSRGGESTEVYRRVKEKIHDMNMPLEKRFQQKPTVDPYVKVTMKGGSKEMTYVPKDSRTKRIEQEDATGEDPEDDAKLTGGRSKRQRRGVKDLGLKAPFQRYHGGGRR
jgi:ribosome biogenesis protein ENP2